MPITSDGSGQITYSEPQNKQRTDKTHTFVDGEFAVCDETNVLKQVKFAINPTTTAKGTLTIACDVGADATVNLSSVGATNTFATIQPITGTSPTASSSTDTLTFANTDGYVTVAGNSTTKTITLGVTGLPATVGITVDGQGFVLTTGYKGYIQVPFACTINSWTILADQSGSAVIDVTKSAIGGYPPTSSITASDKPTLTTATNATGSTLTGWTTAVAAGDILGFNITSVTTCQKLIVSLKVTRT